MLRRAGPRGARPCTLSSAGNCPAYLVNEEHAWHNLSFALFPPLCDLAINLLPHLGADLSCVSSKQRQEALQTQVQLTCCNRLGSLRGWGTEHRKG